MKIKIKEWCLKIASLGTIGHLPLGAQIAALLAFPVLIVLGWLCWLSAIAFYPIATFLVVLIVAAVYGALRCECDHHPGVIVINNLLGMLVAFMFIPLTIKFAAIGFLLFYITKYILPFVLKKLCKCEFDRWPLLLTLLGVDVVAGFVVNIFLQFVWWMAH
jgi:phosphatidylglycerophosphatase A